MYLTKVFVDAAKLIIYSNEKLNKAENARLLGMTTENIWAINEGTYI